MEQQCVGIIGGMSWESTQLYYQKINQQIAQHYGALHSADVLIHSVNFSPVCNWQQRGEWHKLEGMMVKSAVKLEQAGATAIAIATNTMHRCAPAVEAAITVPLLHIATATAGTCLENNCGQVGLLGTRFTMEADFYRTHLEQSGLTVTIPEPAERDDIHRIIYDELCQGVLNPASRQRYIDIMNSMAKKGVKGFVLGCTEIGLLVTSQDVSHTLFDTTDIHVKQIVSHLISA